METALIKAIARIYRAAEKVGVSADVLSEIWAIRELTPEGQWYAVYRWELCMQTWPDALRPAVAA